jgi:hypothetical protein
LVLIGLLFIGCHDGKIRVHLTDPDIRIQGIEIWRRPIKYTWVDWDVEVEVRQTTQMQMLGWRGYYDRYERKIYVVGNSDVLIAHEFGHHLGMIHNRNNQSIMHWRIDTNKALSDFEEFK